ncbi:hypothetical protein NDU88_004270 [Pleurodeles waltl]|uniref:Uncharacterized protein n=1 Tax=Pleurodeles waltl TaxID=8319 RepID=A0AAV7W7S7_PLEWA|nr:hypothetical protein NDU88_004270 [Pleurodeles waltl]
MQPEGDIERPWSPGWQVAPEAESGATDRRTPLPERPSPDSRVVNVDLGQDSGSGDCAPRMVALPLRC